MNTYSIDLSVGSNLLYRYTVAYIVYSMPNCLDVIVSCTLTLSTVNSPALLLITPLYSSP